MNKKIELTDEEVWIVKDAVEDKRQMLDMHIKDQKDNQIKEQIIGKSRICEDIAKKLR